MLSNNPLFLTAVKVPARLLAPKEAGLQPSDLAIQQQLQQLHQFAVVCVNIFSELTLKQQLEYTADIERQRAA
jgi:hypothetical protein